MALRIEDYALIGNLRSGALVGRDGSIDWLCLPRFDSGACFAALLGDPSNGRWSIAPQAPTLATRRRYKGETLVLETEVDTPDGTVRLTDCMCVTSPGHHIIRTVEGIAGSVPMLMELVVRFDYGWIIPWVQRRDGALTLVAGPDALILHGDVETHGEGQKTVAEFTVAAGDRCSFVLGWHPSHEPPPARIDPTATISTDEAWWREWSARCGVSGEWRDPVLRSLITLKALTFEPSGGIVAALTTSLPESIGGGRNWDYRYCWLRDATITLDALRTGGYSREAAAWRDWLLRAAAGDPGQVQIAYGVGGERRIAEVELPWLAGYEASHPVRIGNAAAVQNQLDVYAEVLDALFHAKSAELEHDPDSWSLQRRLVNYVEDHWRDPDHGIWEVRTERRQFTHSKVMAWVALDRALRTAERWGVDAPLERWRRVRAAIHDDVCRAGYDGVRNTFTRIYGSRTLDASLLMLPLVGFLPPDDPRILGTIAAIERELMRDGLLLRYEAEDPASDGVGGREGAFLACTFWLVRCYALVGRQDDARRLFRRLLRLTNDVGLLAEEYDTVLGRQVGNFPQAFSHVGLVMAAASLVA